MTNYYEELGLDRSKKNDEINAELSKLESTWKRREITNPEKATTMLALIIQARKIFASDVTRRTYDNDLDNCTKQPEQEDPNKARSESLKKWRDQAFSFHKSGQYDLAKVAIEKAISLSDINGDDDSVFALAANIYMENNDLQTAMNYINRAIVVAPEVSIYYLSKGLIYDRLAFATMERENYGKATELREEARKMFRIADRKAEQSGSSASRARACGALAFSLYFQDPKDKQEGEKFANLAEKFGGDPMGNADKVLADVKRIHDEQEEARKKKIYDEAIALARDNRCTFSAEKAGNIVALGNAIKKFESLDGWQDSAKQIEMCKESIATIKEKEEREVEEKEKKQQQKAKMRKILIRTVLVSIPIIIIAVFIYNWQHHKCGENLKWSYDSASKTLTITGTGPMYNDFTYWDDGSATDENHTRKKPWDAQSDKCETIIIEDGCTRIGDNAFVCFRNLRNVQIPDSVTSIGDASFDMCGWLENLDLPRNLISIDGNPFEESGIKSLYIPETVEKIDYIGSSVLEEINVDDNNPVFTSLDGVLFNKDRTVLLEYPPAKEGDNYSIPDSVNEIQSNAFYSAYILQSVYIPESVTAIGSYAFICCANLKEINIPSSITSLPESIFDGCGLTTVNIPSQIVEIGDSAYSGCNMNSLYIPEGVEKIGERAFSSCEFLKDITIPQSVTYIGYDAFYNYNPPEGSVIHYSGTQEQWLSLDNDSGFSGVVECTDGNYTYGNQDDFIG